jgi:YesN/AraC family two-component response regulator
VAKSFDKALSLIQKGNYDLAILDIFLPDGNGIDLFQALRKKNGDIYCIMITGNANVENAVTALNEGVNAYLVKPFSDDQLHASINQADRILHLKSQNTTLFRTIENNRQFYENLLNSTSEAIVVVDLEYRLRYSNETSSTILELDSEDTSEKFIYEFFEDGYKILSHIYHQMVEGHIINGYQVTVRSRSGEKFNAHLSADFLYGNKKEIDGLIIKMSNPLVYNELINRTLRKERISTITNLANTLSHVIRNPINILSGRLQLIKNELKKNNFAKAFESIERQIERIITITDLLGKFNFIKEDTIPEKCNIVSVIKNVLEEMTPELNLKKVSITDNLSTKPQWIEGNQFQYADAFKYLFHSLINLMSPDSNIQIREKEVFSEEEIEWYEIQITVPGVRLSTNELFESFHLIDSEKSEFMELELALMHTIFNNYNVKFESIVQSEAQTLIRFHFPIQLKNNVMTKKRYGKI